jgi:hypothetical protein
VFLRGQIGPCPQWLAELDCAAEFSAIEENWIKPGKMLSFYNIPFGLSLIGPPFEGVTEDQGLTLSFYTFPNLELFKEWALGAPEHVAMHTKLMAGLKAAAQAAQGSGVDQPPTVEPSYHFHATDAPRDQIAAIRAELRELYRQIENTDWVGVAPGAVQLMMLGDRA